MATILWLLLVIFAQGIVIFYPGVFVFWLIMHSQIDRWRKVGKRAFWIASIGWPLTAGPLLYFRREVFATRWTMPPFAQILGVIAFLFAVALFLATSKHMRLRTLVGVAELEPERVRQPILNSGIYSRSRNPIYLAHWLLIVSAALMTGFVANWAGVIVDCVVLPLMIRFEERELLARYGSEFAAYMRRVPRFFPKLR